MVLHYLNRWAARFFAAAILFAAAAVANVQTLELVGTALELVEKVESGAVHIGLLDDIDLDEYVADLPATSFSNVSVLPLEIRPTTRSITGLCSSIGRRGNAVGTLPCTLTTSHSLFSVSSTSLMLSNLNLKVSQQYTDTNQYLYDWSQVELLAVDQSSVWMSNVDFNGTGYADDLYHTGIRAKQSVVYAERCNFNLFTSVHGAAVSMVESSTLTLFQSALHGNKVGIKLQSDLEVAQDPLKTLTLPATANSVSTRLLLKESTFTNNGKLASERASVTHGDLVSFDSAIIYKDEDDSQLEYRLTCGGGQDCEKYMKITFQPTSCAGNSAVRFLTGGETWIVATAQDMEAQADVPVDRIRQMPWVGANCPRLDPATRPTKEEDNFDDVELIVIVVIGGVAVGLAVCGQVAALIISWMEWCCFLGCGRRKAVYEP